MGMELNTTCMHCRMGLAHLSSIAAKHNLAMCEVIIYYRKKQITIFNMVVAKTSKVI
jgi:hypothetical protein